MQLACLHFKNKPYIKTFKIHIVAKSSSGAYGKRYLLSNNSCNNKCQLIKKYYSTFFASLCISY